MTTATAATALRSRYGWTEYDRYIGTCRSCKTTFAVRVANGLFATERRICPECGDWTTVTQVIGNVSTVKDCDARCLNAKRSSCECSCGGANHGGGY